jgi:hypothetical protein
LHRPVEGTIKTVALKRETGRWYAVFSCALPDVPPVDACKPAVGIDVGLEAFLTTSDGGREPNPHYLKDALPKLRRLSRAVSRKKKGGSNRRKAVRRLHKFHARVRDLRREHHHQTALKLVRRYGFIVAEKLNVQEMLRNGRLSRATADAGWSGFLLTLRHKADILDIATFPAYIVDMTRRIIDPAIALQMLRDGKPTSEVAAYYGVTSGAIRNIACRNEHSRMVPALDPPAFVGERRTGQGWTRTHRSNRHTR